MWKKILLFILLLVSFLLLRPNMATIVDSYSESNYDFDLIIHNADYYHAGGQSFTGDGGVLNSVKFYLRKRDAPTGTVNAVIYAHTGTFGSNGTPTGSALATSSTYDVSTLGTSPQLITFTFTGAEKITLTDGTKYFVTLDGSNVVGTGTNYVFLEIDNGGSHGGNLAYIEASTWVANSFFDACFYVYKDDAATSIKDIIQPGIIAFPR